MAVEPAQGDTTRAIALKLQRQAVLRDPDKRFCFLLTQQAVLWQLCPPPVMALQVDRLVALSRLPSVRIGILPLGRDVEVGPMNTFTVYDETLATVETFTGQIALRDPNDVAYYLVLFSYFEERALWGDEARAVLVAISGQFARPRE